MSAGSFKQDSFGWRIELIKQRVGEWIEFKTTQLDSDRNWDLEFTWLWQIIKFCLWSIIAVLLVWIVWKLFPLLRSYWKRWSRSEPRNYSITPVHLPQLSAADWVERSQTARIDGDYRGAIFCLYRAMLSLLDERNIIPTQSSLTDEEYRRSLLKMQISPFQSYELLLSIHQRLCFSKAEADRSLFEECKLAYQQIVSNQI